MYLDIYTYFVQTYFFFKNYTFKNHFFGIIYIYLYIFINLNLENINKLNNLSDYINIINLLNSKNNITIIICVYVLIYTNYFKKIKTYILYYLIIYNYNIHNNYTIFNFLEENMNLNLNLMTGLVLIHPIYLYTANSFFLLFLKKNFKKNFFKKKFIFKDKILFYLMLLYSISTTLGIIWANQELLWNGWWSWDLIELIAIIFILNILYILHKKKNFKKKNFLNFYKNLFIIYLSTILVRYNIINSIHNFITLEEQNQYYYYLITLTIYFSIIIILKKNKNTKKFKINFFFYRLKKLFFIISIMYIFIILPSIFLQIKNIYVIYSIFLLSIFYKNIIFLNFFLFFCKITYTYIYLIVTLIIFFKKNYNSKILYIIIHLIFLLFSFNLISESYNHNLLSTKYSIVVLKINSINQSINLFFFKNFAEINFFKLKLCNHVNTETILNKTDLNYSDIFEKMIIFSNNHISENYSYCFQEFLIMGWFFFMFILFFTFFYFFLFFSYIYFRKKKFKL